LIKHNALNISQLNRKGKFCEKNENTGNGFPLSGIYM